MYTKELISKVFNYDRRMIHLEGPNYPFNRQKRLLNELISRIKERAIDKQDTENKIQAIITKTENLIGKIAALISDVEADIRTKDQSAQEEFNQQKEEEIKKRAQILTKSLPGYSEEHHFRAAEHIFNQDLVRGYRNRSEAIICTILVLLVIDLDEQNKDDERLGDDKIDGDLKEIALRIRTLLDIEGWKLFLEFIDHIANKESILWFASKELGFAMRGRVERELLRIETEAKIEEEKGKRVELEKQLEELKRKIKQQSEQEELK